jgi:hypothetical protein
MIKKRHLSIKRKDAPSFKAGRIHHRTNWIQIRIQIVLLGFGVLRLAQQKEREGAGIPGGCSSPAKGWTKT